MSEQNAAPMGEQEQQVEETDEVSMLIESAVQLFPYMKGDSLEERFASLMEALPGIEDDPNLKKQLRELLLPEDPEEVLIASFYSPCNDFIETAKRLNATVKYDPRKDKVEIILPEYSHGHEGHHHSSHHRPRAHRVIRRLRRVA